MYLCARGLSTFVSKTTGREIHVAVFGMSSLLVFEASGRDYAMSDSDLASFESDAAHTPCA